MKTTPVKHRIFLLLALGLTGLPVYAADGHSDDFYQFARKSAELYRGQLFSKPEIDLFVEEISKQNGPNVPATAEVLSAFRQRPYDVDQTARTLQWLEQKCQDLEQRSNRSECAKWQGLKDRLAMHYNMLVQVLETYEG